MDSLFAVNTNFISIHNTYDGLTLDLLQERSSTSVSAKSIAVAALQDAEIELSYIPFTTEYFKDIIYKLENNKGITNGMLQFMYSYYIIFLLLTQTE